MAGPRNRFNLVHVTNLVRGIRLAAESPLAGSRAYFFTDGDDWTMERIARVMADAAGRRTVRVPVPAAAVAVVAAANELAAAITRRPALIGWRKLGEVLNPCWLVSDRAGPGGARLPARHHHGTGHRRNRRMVPGRRMAVMMKPRVILHNAVSADGRIDWFPADIGLFYELAATWHEDATLAGSGTILAAGGAADEPAPGPAAEGTAPRQPAGRPGAPDGTRPAGPADAPDRRPVLAVVDSRGQVKGWRTLLAAGYWRSGVALCSATTPPDHLAWLADHGVERVVTGTDRVDLAAALGELAARFSVKTVRVDSGGKLNGELLRLGLVDEISLLVHPYLVGGTCPASMFRAADLRHEVGVLQLELLQSRKVKQDMVWLRYAVRK